MHADVTGQVLEGAGDFEQATDVIFFFFPLTQLRLGLAGLGKRERLVLDNRNQLRQLIAKVIRKVEHAARIADDSLRGHRAERCDLANSLRTILLAHILDHTPALVLTKINIKVGHRNPFWIQKSFKQQGIWNRVDIRHAQRIRHE